MVDRKSFITVGNDLPKTAADAPKVDAGSPEPLTLEAVVQHFREIAKNPPVGRANVYVPSETLRVSRQHDADGNPLPVSFIAEADGETFVTPEMKEIVNELASHVFNETTLAILKDPNKDFHEVFRNLVSTPPSRDVEVAVPESAPEIQRRVSAVLRTNRFSPTPATAQRFIGEQQSSFVQKGLKMTAVDNRPIGRAQTQLGVYDASAGNITHKDMQKIGLALMLRATGEAVGRDSDPTALLTGLGTEVPGTAQLALGRVVDPKSMRPSDLSVEQGRPEGLGFSEKSLASDMALDGGMNSYGVLNSFLEPFGGFESAGMASLGVVLIAALRVISEGFQLLISAPSPTVGESAGFGFSAEREIKPMGSSQRSDDVSDVSSLIGIRPTVYDFDEAFDRGVDVFFGFSGLNDVGRARLDSIGFYVVFLREIIRSGATIVGSIVDAFSSGNPVSAVLALLDIVDVIKASKVVAYINVMAQLGDKVLLLENLGLRKENTLPRRGEKISQLDLLVENPTTRVGKSRRDGQTTDLAWRTSATPSVFVLPATVINASDLIDDSRLWRAGVSDTGIDLTALNVTNRLSSDIVKEIESELDSEYVPFYFHDLRTNEIVSFHAFLSTLTENYNVSYETSNYYGRVDPVRIYNHTERSINMSFYVASTNESDFDMMWQKINKLVTMLYPQWSKGRKVSSEDNSFIQPFSQIPTASPLIRLRVGDVIRSNYSKFNLARLFGLGTSDFTLQGTNLDPARVTQNIEKFEQDREIVGRMRQKPLFPGEEEKVGFKKGEKAILLPLNNINLAPTLGLPGSSNDPPLIRIDQHTPVLIDDVKFDDTGLWYAVSLITPVPGRVKGPYRVNFSSLRVDFDYVRKELRSSNELDDAIFQESVKEVAKFFDGDENAIVRSFESVAGRGLAGVITTFSTDWAKPTWDTTGIGRRAPQWAQITMQFMPVHDIAPGIDADGFNRAPLYNVGDIVNSYSGDPLNDKQSEEKLTKYTNAARKRLKKE